MNPNGHLPEGAVLLTREHLAKSIVPVLLPTRSAGEGQPVYVTIRPIRQAAYFGWLPDLPEEAKDWPEDPVARVQRFKAWKAGVSPDVRAAWDQRDEDSTYRIVQAGLVAPILTVEEIRLLGSDADVLAHAILVLSGLAEAKKETGGPEATQGDETPLDPVAPVASASGMPA